MLQTDECPTCEASLRTRGRRWLLSLALAFAAGGVAGILVAGVL